jgi:transposase
MNYTQNTKISQVTNETLVIGIDVGSETHFARAFDNRGYEHSKKAFKFGNTKAGFAELLGWMRHIGEEHGKTHILPGMEPTGHYWFNLGRYLADNGIRPVLVNPYHVKQSKELDDNSQTKSDRKDPKVIAGLVKDGRYSYPYIPEGVYAELRNASNLRFQLTEELARAKNRIKRWFSIYFPEHKEVYGKFDAAGSMMVLRQAPLPEDIVALGADGVNRIWRDAKLRAAGMKRAKALAEAAGRSIGSKEGLTTARFEIAELLGEYEAKRASLDKTMELIERLCQQVPMAGKLLAIKGVGLKTVSGFLAEVGDIRRFSNPKQLQKLAGLSLVEDSSGKHKGESRISRRGRKRLRHLLFEVSMCLVAKNPEFGEIHRYFTTRPDNPLKKMQSLMAIACKLIRVFYAILTKGVDFDASKMMGDIKRPRSCATVA